MPDIHTTIAASAQIHTGFGFLTGLVVSNSGAAGGKLSLFDNVGAGGTLVFQIDVAPVAAEQPFTLFFSDRFAPRFTAGLYAQLAVGMSLNVWAVGV
jgi:hypothetical protein